MLRLLSTTIFVNSSSPYSPDMNPIEETFGFGKKWLQRHPEVCARHPKWCFEQALDQVNMFTSQVY